MRAATRGRAEAYRLHLQPLLLLLLLRLQPGSCELVACSVAEELPSGTLVCDLAERTGGQATGQSVGITTSPQYQLVSREDAAARYFDLDSSRGLLRLATSIDREAIRACRSAPDRPCRLDLAVTFLRDADDPSSMRLLDVLVTVEDINDNSPTFAGEQQQRGGVVQGRVREHDRLARIQLPKAFDPDAGKNGSVVYSFPADKQGHGDYLKFALEEDKENGRSPVIRVVGDIDLEGDEKVGGRLDLVVVASDEGVPARSASLTVAVSVENANDFEPVFEPGAKLHLVRENATVNSVLFTVRAVDRDEPSGTASQLTYAIRRSEPPAPFAIDRRSGDVRLRSALNAEERQHYSFDVEVSDNHRPEPRTAAITVSVKVEDVNDNPPEIRVSPASPARGLSVLENQPSAMIAILDVTDRDVEQQNRLLDCDLHRFSQLTDAFVLLLDSPRGDHQSSLRFILKNTRPLDRETQAEHRLSLTCSDSAGLSAERQFTVTVRDVNDSPPRFAGSVTRLKFPENQAPNTVMGTVTALDADEAENADTRYEIADSCAGLVGIGERNGTVYSKVRFDRELNATLHCTVRAYDAKRPDMQAVTSLQVEVEDLNDCRPVFRSDNFTFLVPENHRPSAIGRVEATDADAGENARLTYSLAQPNGAFRVTASGEILMVGGPGRGLNREHQSSHSLRVRVQDHGRPPQTAETTVTIEVVDENDNSPRFVFPSSRNSSLNVSVHERPGAIVAKVTAVDDDSGRNGQLTFDLEPLLASGACDRDLFRLDADTGQLLLAQTVPLAFADRASCRLVIAASDRGAEPRRTTQSLTVRFTASRPRSPVAGAGGAHGADSIGTGEAGTGSLPGSRKGPRDLVVITVCVALSFLVLLCVVLLLAYFCYYLQAPGLGTAGRGRGRGIATGRGEAGAGTGGGKLAGSRWLKRLGFGGPGSNPDAGLGGQRAAACGASFNSRPVMQLKAADYLDDTVGPEEDDELQQSQQQQQQQHQHYLTEQRRRISGAGPPNQPVAQYPSRRGSAFSHVGAATSAATAAAAAAFAASAAVPQPPLYVDSGGCFDYQTMMASRRQNYLSVDSKMPDTLAGHPGSSGYYKSLRPPSTDPTQRRGLSSGGRQLPAGAEAATSRGESPGGRGFQTVQYLVDSPVPGAGATVMTRLEQTRAAPGGYVYGSPYLTSSFV